MHLRSTALSFRASLAVSALVIAMAASAPAASAQTAADSAGLVDAVVADFGGYVESHQRRGEKLYLAPPTTAFDARVTRRMQDAHGLALMRANLDTATWIGTQGFEMRGDTVEVTMTMGEHREPSDNGLSGWLDTYRLTFVRDGTAWRLTRRELVSHGVVGRVRNYP